MPFHWATKLHATRIYTAPRHSHAEVLPQVLDGLLEDTSRAVDIYSALRDPIRGSVRLYLEFLPVHPDNKKKDEPEIWAYEVLKSCVFSHHRNFSQTMEVPVSKVRCCPVLT